LARDLPAGEGYVGSVAFAPALVATEAAVRDPSVAMPDDVFRRELMPALALGTTGITTWARRSGHGAQVIQVHAPTVAAPTLDPRRRR